MKNGRVEYNDYNEENEEVGSCECGPTTPTCECGRGPRLANADWSKLCSHIKQHQKLYAAGAIFIAGVVVGCFLKNKPSLAIQGNNAQVIYKPTGSTITTIVERRGNPGDIIRDTKTGELWGSRNRCAEVNNIPVRTLRKHLSGGLPNINGRTFESLGPNV